MEKWLRFQPDRTVRLAVGKVELGQGNVTALAQIAAEELDVDLDRIAVLSGDTQDAPDEGQTTSSQSIEVSGRSVRLVTAELRARVLDRLARRLNCSPAEISVEDGAFPSRRCADRARLLELRCGRGFRRAISTAPRRPKPPSAYRVVGKPMPRRDLPAKVTRRGVHPRHGAAGHAARAHPAPASARRDAGGARTKRRCGAPPGGEFRVVRVGNFVAFVGAGRDGGATRRRRRAGCMRRGTTCRSSRRTCRRRRGWSGSPSNDRVHVDRGSHGHRRRPWWRRAIRGPMSRMRRWRRPVRWRNIATASVGLVAHAGAVSAARVAGQRAGHASRTPSPCGTRMAPAATAITAPTTWRWMRR